ncbi:MAG TPA: RNase H family protein [Candidatus Binatus sp.]|nr:RNase H family protein [Candidatus Binatus sp.]
MKIWIDGAGALLPGQKAKYCIVFEDGTTVKQSLDKGTNNEMEYFALLQALNDQRSKDASILTDSQLLVGQLQNGWKVKAENLKEIHEECRNLLRARNATLSWIPREENLAGKVLERKETAASEHR